MEWICSVFELQNSDISTLSNISLVILRGHLWNESTNYTSESGNKSRFFTFDELDDETNKEELKEDHFAHIVMHYIVPIVCCCGILGNSLNALILGNKISKGVDRMEKGAIIGLLALAFSDLAFCIAMVLIVSVPHNMLMFRSKTLSYYVTLYETFVINTLIKVSTWYILVLNLGRYYAVCFPMQARRYLRYSHTVLGLAFGTVFWICIHLPMLWAWKISEVDCSDEYPNLGKIYALTVRNQHQFGFYEIFEYIWAILGVFIPAGVLVYCNVKLVQSLQKSSRLKQLPGIKRNVQVMERQKRLSITLISIAMLFFLLVFPSEVTRFYGRKGKCNYMFTCGQVQKNGPRV